MKRFRKCFSTVFLLFILLISITACQKGKTDSDRLSADKIKEDNQIENTQNSTQSNTQENTQSESQEEDNTKKTRYPLTIKTTSPGGKEYTTVYEKAPEKVVAVYQGSIETMLALGLSDRLIAAAGLDNEVPDELKSAFSKVNYLDEFTPSKETITMLEPDMILSWSSYFGEKTLGDAKEWIDKGVNVYMNTNTASDQSTLENEYEDILKIGEIFDVQDKAQKIVNEMKETVENVKERAKSQGENPSVLVIESEKDSFRNYGKSSIAGDMVTQLGGTLANENASSLGKEDLISADPDVIFVVYMPYAGDDPDTVKNEALDKVFADSSLSSLNAVKNKRVIPIMLSEMYASATRTKDGIETIAKGLYPDLE